MNFGNFDFSNYDKAPVGGSEDEGTKEVAEANSEATDKPVTKRDAILKYLGPDAIVPDGVGSVSYRKVITGCYDHYIAYGVVPSVEVLAKETGMQKKTISKVMATSEFKEAMERRGVRMTDEVGLSPEQSYTLALITNPADRRPLRTKLQSAGVPYTKYRAWLKDPLFSRYFNRLTENSLQESQGAVLVALANKAMDGDMRAIPYFLEVTGRHNPAQQSAMDVQSVLLSVVEIITKHVTDPKTLQAIATEMQMKGIGGSGAGNHTTVVGSSTTEIGR